MNTARSIKSSSIIASLTLSFSLLLASAPARAGGEHQSLQGAVLTRRPSVHAIVQGPVLLRAYPQFDLGTVFLADATGDTDKACKAATAGETAKDLTGNRRLDVRVPAGKVACVSIKKDGLQELLWRARTSKAADVTLATR